MADVHSKEERSINMDERIFKLPEIFLMNDQPFTCPYCGTRCEIIASFKLAKTLIEKCLNKDCEFICCEEEDEELLHCGSCEEIAIQFFNLN